jgi:hypothetical protein
LPLRVEVFVAEEHNLALMSELNSDNVILDLFVPVVNSNCVDLPLLRRTIRWLSGMFSSIETSKLYAAGLDT